MYVGSWDLMHNRHFGKYLLTVKCTQVHTGPLPVNEYLQGMSQTELIFSPLTCTFSLLTLEFPVEVNELVVLPATPLEI